MVLAADPDPAPAIFESVDVIPVAAQLTDQKNLNENPAIRRSRIVRLDEASLLRGRSIEINLFDGVTYTAEILRPPSMSSVGSR